MDRTRTALREMAREDPELAARLVLLSLPAAAARIPPPLAYDLSLGELGAYRISVTGEGATVERYPDGADGDELDADAVYRALAYLIDPDWTRGHRFTVCYEVTGEGGGAWFVQVCDG